jgi:hypothetical protein
MMTDSNLPVRRYSNDDLRAFHPEVDGLKATFLMPYGPRREGDMIPCGLGVDSDYFSSSDTITPGETVTLTGCFWLQVEYDYTDEGCEIYEYEFAEVKTSRGVKGFVPFNEITQESFGGFYVEVP